MQAIIMAGGQGSRLRPLTCNIPKPLAPLCGRPVIEYILELLIKHRFDRAVLTLLYLGDKIEGHFDNNEYKGLELCHSYETTPLGTAGSVRHAAQSLFESGRLGEDVLIISADAMCDFDLSQALSQHRRNNADATIIVKRVDDPREYGLVRLAQDGRVEGFLEKPSYTSCITDLANTGVYILSPRVLELIPEGKQSDFAQDIFPAMLQQNMRLFGYEEGGYWCDIGDFQSYIRCQQDMLAGKVACDLEGHRSLEGIITCDRVKLEEVIVTPPVYIGKNVTIGRGTVIDAGTVIGDNVTIGGGCKLHGAILLSGAYLGERVSCNDAVICENARLMQGSSVFEGAVIGESAVVGESGVVESGVKLWQAKQLAAGSTASYDIKYGFGKNLTCDEEGITGETNVAITPQIACKLGSAAAALAGRGGVGVSQTGGRAAKAIKLAFMAGVMSAGGTVWDFGECIAPVHEFCMHKSGAVFGAHIHGGVTTHFHLSDRSGIPLTRKEERTLEGCLNRGEYAKAAWNAFGERIDLSGMAAMYGAELERLIPDRLQGIKGVVKSPSTEIKELLGSVLANCNDKGGREIVLHMTQNGRKLSAFTPETGFVRYETLVLICCEGHFKQGIDVALPYSFPAVADLLAEQYGRTVHRYYTCSCDDSDREARHIAQGMSFTRDAMTLGLLLLKRLSDERITLLQAVQALPQFAAKNRYIEVDASPMTLLGRLCKEKDQAAEGGEKSGIVAKGGLGEGVVLREKNGRVLIRPIKTGRGLLVFAESYQSETAAELCDSYEKLIKTMQHLDSTNI